MIPMPVGSVGSGGCACLVLGSMFLSCGGISWYYWGVGWAFVNTAILFGAFMCLEWAASKNTALEVEVNAQTMVRVNCSHKKKLFSILFRRHSPDEWVALKAFKRDDVKQEEAITAKSVIGRLFMDEAYLGCPFCGNKAIFRCEQWGMLNCQGTAMASADGKIFLKCGNCPSTGFLDQRDVEIRGSAEG